MPYCENCGSQVNPNAKFCRNCGAALSGEGINPQPPQTPASASSSPPVQTAVPQPPLVTQPAPLSEFGSESVVGVILFKKERSFGRWDTFTGVLTSQRVIFAQMTSEMMKVAVQQVRDQAKAEGKGFFGQWAEQLKAMYSYGQKYFGMSPSAILAETPGNFELGNNAVSEVKLGRKENRQNQQIYEFTVEFRSAAGKFEYVMDQNGDYVKLLRRVYGERVKTPLGYFLEAVVGWRVAACLVFAWDRKSYSLMWR